MLRAWRYLWASPTTLVGLLFLPVAWLSGGRAYCIRGAIEVHGGLVSRFLLLISANAMTLGHVILGTSQGCLELVREHEHVHVRQCERWGGFFLPAYVWFSFLAWSQGRDYYRDNRFEVEAYAISGEVL